jgi:branched-chain amino acid aminotransferase
MHRFLLHNGEIRDAGDRFLAAGQVGLLSGWGVFSTIRVYDGVMFQFERHWQRMRRDAERIRVPFPADPAEFEADLRRLIEANQAWNSTLRCSVVRNQGGLFEGPGQTRGFDVIGFTREVAHWPSSMKLGLVYHGRHAASEFAGTKYISWAENLTRYERAHDQGLDEVVLLNERGEVSECTSANIFVIHGNKVSTPALSSGCLPGVTRALLLEETDLNDVEIRERVLLPADLETADCVFITSTTRELLPVSAVERLNIHTRSEVMPRLQAAFSRIVKEYVEPRRKPVTAY